MSISIRHHLRSLVFLKHINNVTFHCHTVFKDIQKFRCYFQPKNHLNYFPSKTYSWWGMVGGCKKFRPASSSSVTSTNVRTSPENLRLLVLNILPHWCKISSLYLVPIPNYWTWTKTTPQKSDCSGQILLKLSLW